MTLRLRKAGAAALLVIEDLQWADRETLEVVEYLADHLSGHAALVVATLRDDERGLAASWCPRCGLAGRSSRSTCPRLIRRNPR